MDTYTAPDYIRQNFERDDRLAIVFVSKSGPPLQRIAPAERLVADSFQRFTRYMNSRRFEVYISMNALAPDASHRRKEDIAAIRHIYLDFDHNGTEAVRAMRSRADIPMPNHVIETSPGRYQTIWRVQGFELSQAEQLMRGMVRDLGADPAAVDASRVLRLPGLFNHKRDRPYFIRVDTLTDEVYRPSHFPVFAAAEVLGRATDHPVGHRLRTAGAAITQSERDWASTKRALALGAQPDELIQTLTSQRTDKPNPRYYAELTVAKALRAVEEERQRRLSGSRTKSQNGLGIGG